MIERRISTRRWSELTEELQDVIKQTSKQYASDIGFDHEFEYYWIKFDPEAWFTAVIAEPQIESLIT